MMELNEFFEFLKDKSDSDLNEEDLLRKQKYSKEYAKYLMDSYEKHPIKSLKAFRLIKKTKKDYYVSNMNTYSELIPIALFDEIGVTLKRNTWYEAVIIRDFYTDAPVRIESIEVIE